MTDTQPRQPLFTQPAFWATCFLDERALEVPDSDSGTSFEDDEGVDDLVATYDFGDGYVLGVNCDITGASLELSHPGAAKPALLAWDDLVHWHPHALRWSEADLICRAIALTDPHYGYPGPLSALIGRFAPACDETDAAAAVPLHREAFARLPGLNRYQRLAYAARSDIRAFGVHWLSDDETGWWYPDQYAWNEEGNDPFRGDPDAKDYPAGALYSMRHPDESDFPFAPLDALIDRARTVCAALLSQAWATQADVQTAAEAFAADPTSEHRQALADALHGAGCADAAVLAALAPDAGELRALVMTELLTGAEPCSVVRRRVGSDIPKPLRRYSAHAYVPVASGAPRGGFASNLKPHLNAALRTAGLGSTEDGPARVGRKGHDFDDLPLEIIDDWRAGLELVREVLRTAGAPEGTTVEIQRRDETMTADLHQPLPHD